MKNISLSKIFLTIIISILALLVVYPNFQDVKESSFLPDAKINLGLDLKGGSHLLLEVDFDSYLQDLYESISESAKKLLRDEKIPYRNIKFSKLGVSFELRNASDMSLVHEKLKLLYPDIVTFGSNINVSLSYDEYGINRLQDKVIDQSIEIVRMRVDSSGTKEPSIQRQGSSYILLQIPGEENPQRLKEIIGKTAKLNFYLVDEKYTVDFSQNNIVPADSKLVYGQNAEHVLVKKRVLLSGDMLTNAQVSFDKDSVPVVGISFNSLGAKKFADVTTNYRGRRLAMVLDDQLLCSPVINVPILGGDAIITGNFTIETANDLALLLRAGSLPAPLKVVEERTVGPNLGLDSIESGKRAALIGFALVVVFMFLAYGMLGIFANISLVLSLLYIFALLTALQATLTLPGIAGIILTIGMAVDANVLIYERIKEELRKQNISNNYAIQTGFQSAFSTIMDSNITTLIAAFLLYNFGVGAIRGFAVTLTIGIISSMYSSLVITKLMIDLWVRYWKPKSLGLIKI